MIFDWRHLQAKSGPPPKMRGGKQIYPGRIAKGKLVMRDPKSVDSITLHQTACLFSPTGVALTKHGGDRRMAILERAMSVRAHATAFQSGDAVIAYPLMSYVYHANSLNSRSIGLEGEGHFKEMQSAPEELVTAMCEAVEWICTHAAREGATIKYIFAHRQSNKDRAVDPGRGIWKPVAVDFARKVLGLKTMPTDSFGTGHPIPAAWYV